MISKIYESNFFAKTFTLGLLLLFLDVIKDFFGELLTIEFPSVISTLLFVAGLTICLVSLLFLLIEWMTLPFGMQTKRIKLYQGVGNLTALLMLVGAWFVKEQITLQSASAPVLMLGLAGLSLALIFGLAGKSIADTISRKKVVLYNSERSFPPNGELLVREKVKDSGRVNTNDISQNPVIQH